jgi:hypothetical protein
MDIKRRNILLICGAVFLASYIVRSFVIGAMQMNYYQQQAARAAQRKQAKPAPFAPPARPEAPKSGSPAPPLPKAGSDFFSASPGIWLGHAALSGKGVCDLRFELRKAEEPDHFLGYSALTCRSNGPLTSKDRSSAAAVALNRLSPEAAILSGSLDNGALHFHTDKVVGTDSGGCAPASFTLTPFCPVLIAAEWDEGTCGVNHMILRKARQ